MFICFALSTLSYAFIGFVRGDARQSQVTLNLPSGKASSKVSIYTTLVKPLTKYALVVAPEAVEDALGPASSAAKGRPALLRVLVVRTAVAAATVALTVPFFGDVVFLTGAAHCSSARPPCCSRACATSGSAPR
jgi:solute carrier family 32 (vesicular inhibitory amino acid transporter)